MQALKVILLITVAFLSASSEANEVGKIRIYHCEGPSLAMDYQVADLGAAFPKLASGLQRLFRISYRVYLKAGGRPVLSGAESAVAFPKPEKGIWDYAFAENAQAGPTEPLQSIWITESKDAGISAMYSRGAYRAQELSCALI